jgi:hypothetical protein
MKTLRIATLLLGAFFLFGNAALTDAAWAEDKPDTDLAKQSQNPVSDLISVPFENNLNFTAGTEDAYVNVLNVKPVLPVRIAENWNLINRAIIPIVYQGERFPGEGSEFGTVLFGGGIGRVFKIGKQPVNVKLAAYWNAEKPRWAADWNVQAQITFLFPK